ncbi:hypothetical protein D3C86_1790300 [compost metagenome]
MRPAVTRVVGNHDVARADDDGFAYEAPAYAHAAQVHGNVLRVHEELAARIE